MSGEGAQRLSPDDQPLGAVRVDDHGRPFIRVADDLGTKWWVHVLPAEEDGESIWQRGIDLSATSDADLMRQVADDAYAALARVRDEGAGS